MRRKTCFKAGVGVLAFFWFLSPVLATEYEIIDLGIDIAADINNKGTVVGTYNSKPVLWEKGVKTELVSETGGASGINELGQVVGSYRDNNDNYHGFLWDGVSLRNIGTGEYKFTSPSAINNNGVITGTAWNDFDNSGVRDKSTVYWKDNIAYNIPGTQTREGMGGTNSYLPVAINDHDLIVGTYFRIGRRSGTTSEWKFDINSSEFAENFSSMDWVEDVNNSGQIAGRGWDGISAYGACYWDNNEIVVIDPDPDDYSYSSMAVGINEKKQIIGLRDYGDFRTAWIWENGEMKELIRLDNERTLNYLSKINDLGQIIGGGTLNGESHAFLLTPAGIIPEPSSLLMFGLGMLGLLSRKNKILRLRR